MQDISKLRYLNFKNTDALLMDDDSPTLKVIELTVKNTGAPFYAGWQNMW